jgi:hypothetical protein
MGALEGQGAFEEFMDLQTRFVDIVAPTEEAKIAWAEKHGENFRLFYEHAGPELKERLVRAIKEGDSHAGLSLIEEFARYEKESAETLH